MMEICEKERCTACRACMNICPKSAITFHEDKKGFAYPIVDEACIHCGLCINVCPRNTGLMVNKNNSTVYAAFTKNKEIRRKSSSGGIFSELALNTIKHGGVIFASRLNENCTDVYFDCCRSAEELEKFQGSKYVQSNPDLIFQNVKKELRTKNWFYLLVFLVRLMV